MGETSGRARLYLLLAVVGLVTPPALLTAWFVDNGFDLGAMLDAAFENKVAIAVFCDLSIASLAFWAWIADEAPRLGIRNWGWLIPANIFIGLCFALPLYLYWRERAVAGSGAAAPA